MPKPVKSIRTAAFASTIKEVYDYRCAASGLRFRLGDLTIVDACHLIPFAESGNDHPTNGIALSKNHPPSRATAWQATGPEELKPLRRSRRSLS